MKEFPSKRIQWIFSTKFVWYNSQL